MIEDVPGHDLVRFLNELDQMQLILRLRRISAHKEAVTVLLPELRLAAAGLVLQVFEHRMLLVHDPKFVFKLKSFS